MITYLGWPVVLRESKRVGVGEEEERDGGRQSEIQREAE